MKKLGFICLLAVFMFFIDAGSIAASATEEEDKTDFMDGIIEEKVKEGNIPNATVSVVYLGDTILEKGYGYSNMDTETAVDPETTLFRIGSISKLFTWTAVMQLVEEGKLSLDRDVNEYLDFHIPPHAESGPITLRHLMTHTPGVEDSSDSTFKLEAEGMMPLREYIQEHLPERVFPAGEVLAYSNYGTALAGYIVEQVSGMPFSRYGDENIFTPLDMDYSTFEQPLPDGLTEHMSTPYRYVDGHFAEGAFEFMPEPAGAMSTSASDMANFMIAYLQEGQFDGKKILEKNTVQQMFEQQFTQHPDLAGMSLGFIEGNFNGKRVLFHGGSTMLYNAALYLLPDEEIGIFIAYSGGDYFLHNDVFEQFIDEFFPEEESANLVSPAGAEERANQYVGEYHQNRKSITTSEKLMSLLMGVISVEADEDGQLYVTHAGETNTFVEVEPGMYESARMERTPDPYGNFKKIIFAEDADGKMMLMADGPMTYTKAPWHSGSTFTFVMIAMSVLFIIGTLLSWAIAAMFRNLRHRKKASGSFANKAKVAAIAYGAVTVLFLASVMVNGELDPLYQLPRVAYGEIPGWASVLDFIPYLIVLFSLLLVVCAVFVWKKKVWTLFGRIHYMLYTATALFFAWFFLHWNFIF